MYHDIIATYTFDRTARFAGGLLANSSISLGIQNLFNKSPPILATTSTLSGFYSPYGDPRLRRYSVTLRKAFGK
jgi:outer membrane receptor protein involved in Fe transport